MSGGHDEWAAARDLAAAEAEQAAGRGELDFLIDSAAHYARRASEVASEQATCGIAVVDETTSNLSDQLGLLAAQLQLLRGLVRATDTARPRR